MVDRFLSDQKQLQLNSIEPHVVLCFSKDLKSFSVIFVCKDEDTEKLRKRVEKMIGQGL